MTKSPNPIDAEIGARAAEMAPNLIEAVQARFLSKVAVDPVTGCWLWMGYVSPYTGYGQFWDGERLRGAHQSAYELFVGPIPPGTVPDHLCRTRHCACPDHLEAVTQRVNLLRGDTVTARRAAQLVCQKGHPLSGENLYRNRNGTRACRTCKAEGNRRWAAANRERRREIDRESYRRRASAGAAR